VPITKSKLDVGIINLYLIINILIKMFISVKKIITLLANLINNIIIDMILLINTRP